MPTPLRVLFVEDTEDDVLLVRRELERGGFSPSIYRVETRAAMEAALDAESWDIILSDYTLPAFSGVGALALVKERGIDLPFIIISGTINEDAAVTALKVGAHDFVRKDNLARFLPAVERELREARLRAEQRATKLQLQISDRMASVGTLAASVAHEINNPLTAVIGNLDLALNDVIGLTEKDLSAASIETLRGMLRTARDAAERIKRIAGDLRILSRGDDEKNEPVDVEHVLESALRIASNDIRHRARVIKHYERVPPAEANESRLGQVFLNLLVNAAQAIQEGHADENEIRLSTRVEQGWVVVEIADTGHGIPPEVMDKLFTPFFTTKPIGIGTGLGLSICHRIVGGFGGSIEAAGSPSGGAVFSVRLPAATETLSQSSVQAAPPEAGRRGKILVVDDEQMITDILAAMLAPAHDVTTTQSPREALSMITSGERFDVIFCDLMMPDMTGMAFHAELLRLVPEQAAAMVFLTGGAFTLSAKSFLAHTSNPTLQKPFDINAILTMIKERVG